MRKPRLEDFDPNRSGYPLEDIDVSDVTPIQDHIAPSPAAIPIPREGIVIPRHRDTTDDTMPPSNHGTIRAVRKAVREIGKEAATHRFTVQEKQSVAEIVFNYRQKGVKTSENEIARIALNYVMEDFRQQGDDSLLAKVLEELNT
jgi:hypothetical protein